MAVARYPDRDPIVRSIEEQQERIEPQRPTLEVGEKSGATLVEHHRLTEAREIEKQTAILDRRQVGIMRHDGRLRAQDRSCHAMRAAPGWNALSRKRLALIIVDEMSSVRGR